MPHRRIPPAPFVRTGSLLAATAATGFGVVLGSGAAQAVTTTPTYKLAVVRPTQLWETHRQHVIHQARLDRGYYNSDSTWTTATDSGGRTWGVSYGYPNKCGDGDGDGWDVNCATRNAQPAAAQPAAAPARVVSVGASSVSAAPGTYSVAGLEQLWTSAGGPSWAAAHAASIAECESGGRTNAFNPSGATGLWQILGSVVPGNLDNPQVNAANAVSKFNASGQTFAQWVCK